MLNRIMKTVTFPPIEQPGGPGTGPVTATPLYRSDETGNNVGSIRASLQLKSTSTVPVPLSQFTIRYWFTQDGSSAHTMEIDYAVVGKKIISRPPSSRSRSRSLMPMPTLKSPSRTGQAVWLLPVRPERSSSVFIRITMRIIARPTITPSGRN
ncbi:cellulose binding domain-containing protein [Paenibacillus rhizoplanae]